MFGGIRSGAEKCNWGRIQNRVYAKVMGLSGTRTKAAERQHSPNGQLGTGPDRSTRRGTAGSYL
jgi:predicted Fe-S protein YdhL (DUF1289 family)